MLAHPHGGGFNIKHVGVWWNSLMLHIAGAEKWYNLESNNRAIALLWHIQG
jgi:hypothetical protein